MKPPSFEYLAPSSTAEAIEMLGRYRDEARVLAGGQSLVPIMNFRLARFKFLIDINSIAGLSFIVVESGLLRIGALTRYRAIENSAAVAETAPLLALATKSVGHLPIRTRGTIGGSLAHADPAAEYPAVLLALGATIIVRSQRRERGVAATEFIKGVFVTALESDELLTEVQIPVATRNHRFGFAELARRPGDLAIMGVATCLEFDRDLIHRARIAVFGGSEGATRISAAEGALLGSVGSSDDVERASVAAASIPTHSDVHATAALRSHLATALTRRALSSALATQRLT